MSEIWLTSDLHFMHNKPFLFEPRGFKTTEEMCEQVIENWNKVVQPGDIIYNLGDISLSNVDAAIPYLRRLNGNQIWIRGNHDTENKILKILKACPNIELLSDDWNAAYATVLKYGKWSFYLSHYPTITGNHEEWRKVVNLCGHSHTKDRWADWDKSCYHVEMDAHGCWPVHIDDIKQEIKDKRTEESVPVLNVSNTYQMPRPTDEIPILKL